MTERGGCGEFARAAAELALGVLTGRERAEALAHLEACDTCRETVRQFAATGEGLLGLLPAAEPPPGFESRVLARIGIAVPGTVPVPGTAPARGAVPAPGAASFPGHARRTGPARARRARRPVPGRRVLAAAVVVVAVVVAVVAAGFGGWALRGAGARSAPAAASSPLRSAALVSASHQTVGEVFYYPAGQPWMHMTVDLPSGDGTVKCELERPGGRYSLLGSFRITGGYGSWGGDAGYGQVTGARLVTASGTVLATASFPAAQGRR